jgi:Peptidase A4 family
LEETLRNKLYTKVAGRLCTIGLSVAFALCGLSPRVMAGGMPPAGSVASNQSVAQAVIVASQPPAGFSPLAASDQDLADYGFPPKPDPQSAPKAYAKWRMLVSVPRAANPQLIQTNIYNRPAQRVSTGKTLSNGIVSVTSGNWSGYAAVGPTGTFTPNSSFVYQQWIVPVAEQAHGVCNGFWDYSSQWPGFDGFGSSDVLQGGTEVDAYCAPDPVGASNIQNSFYSAWIEWYPFPETRVSAPPVQPGNFMVGEVWYTTSAPSGHVYLANYTLYTSASYAFNPPSGTTFAGNSAEWIMERPRVNGGLADLTNYNGLADSFNVDYAYNTHSYFYPAAVPSGSTDYAITMTCPPWNPSSSCTSTTAISTPFLYDTYALWFYDGGPAY